MKLKRKRHARFPEHKILDGTFRKLNQCDWQVLMVIAVNIDYYTHESWVKYATIRKHITETSGKRIHASIVKLQKLKLIESWKEPKRNISGTTGPLERRLYRVLY